MRILSGKQNTAASRSAVAFEGYLREQRNRELPHQRCRQPERLIESEAARGTAPVEAGNPYLISAMVLELSVVVLSNAPE